MDPQSATADARTKAAEAARRSSVRIRPLESTEDSFDCERFLAEVWQAEPDRPPLAADVIKAMADGGSYVAGAFDARLVGVCIGLWGPPNSSELHSHLAGVDASTRGRAVGFALKLDQRAHALENGVHEITWTFDPLVARNAHFNLRKLGGSVDKYLVNHYGVLPDGLNGDDDSDRLLLRWDLLGSQAPTTVAPTPRAVLVADGGRPVAVPCDDRFVLVAVPDDIEKLRTDRPSLAKQWRLTIRDVLGSALANGGRLVDFDRSAGGYLLDRGER